MRFNQTGSAVAHQQCLENAIPPHSGKIIGVQQRHTRLQDLTVKRDHHARLPQHVPAA
ncbi:hypothetical protein VNDN049_08370 [Mycobacterium tuberculosis]|nr:hypothetical protein VNDN049_08370 [Mycobacterium tuberculosis]